MDCASSIRPVISPANKKLGLLPSWSIIVAAYVCIGRTRLCWKYCYARKHHFVMASMIETLKRNYEFSKSAEFVPWMHKRLEDLNCRVFRIHVAGDFYNPEYTEKWLRIVQRRQEIIFLCYTRSWSDPDVRGVLRKLAQLPNMRLWLSADSQNWPVRVRIPGSRIAYMAVSDEDARRACLAKRTPDIVFRTNRHSIRKEFNGVIVCPAENGIRLDAPITCTTCGLCWNLNQPQPERLKLRHRENRR